MTKNYQFRYIFVQCFNHKEEGTRIYVMIFMCIISYDEKNIAIYLIISDDIRNLI